MGVTEEFYQPSLVDIGTVIYVQVLPVVNDMDYIGMPISKHIGPIVLSPETKEEVEELL